MINSNTSNSNTRTLLLTLSIFFMIVTNGLGQKTLSGTKVLGGAITYNQTENAGYYEIGKLTELEILPSFGYFAKDDWMAGLALGYSQTKNGSSKTSGPIVNPFGRYYVHADNENLFFYFQLSYSLFTGKTKSEVNNVEISSGKWDISIAPGLTYFLSDKIAIDLSFRGIAYGVTDPNKDIDDDETKVTQIGLNSLKPYSLGFRWYF